MLAGRVADHRAHPHSRRRLDDSLIAVDSRGPRHEARRAALQASAAEAAPREHERISDRRRRSNAGVLRFGAIGTSDTAWSRGSLVARIPTPGRRWSSISRGPEWTGFRGATAVLALASIFHAGAGNLVGWAVDAAIVEPFIPIGVPEPDDYVRIQALLAICGTEGILYRLFYQVTALGAIHT